MSVFYMWKECEVGGLWCISFSKMTAIMSFILHAFLKNVSLQLAYQEMDFILNLP